jgi:starch phosphorylase
MSDREEILERFPNLPPRLAGLGELAFNLWWSWNPGARILFKRLNREAWKDAFYNPVKLLATLPKEILADVAADPNYLKDYDDILEQFHRDLETEVCWFTENITGAECHPIAYFSLEYGLHRSLPFYAGGLGFLAGDFLKECSDLGIPMVAVGFMYPDGYVRQKINADGWQEGADETLDRDNAPIIRVLDAEGNQVVVPVPFTDPPIYVAVWKAMVGRIPLYLMDTDLPRNEPAHRRISNHLYISEPEERLLQEIVLGLGGNEMLEILGIKHSVLHLNEGHAAFALLERLRDRIEKDHLSFEDAVREVRATSVFTTHTPVPAGNEVHPLPDLLRLGAGCDLVERELKEIGGDPFNMTVAGLRLARSANAVSQLHAETARAMWAHVPDAAPIIGITNGVHVGTWQDPRIARALDDDEALRAARRALKQELVAEIQARTGARLDPDALTVGFARRAATYKRPDLLLRDPERLDRLLAGRRVQLVFSGKAHPADAAGKAMIARLVEAIRRWPDAIVFLENYDMGLARRLTRGCDVWLNTPRRPLEASGTSGMKAAMNGGLNVSVLDGWWPEGWEPGATGWAIGDGTESPGDQDERDLEALYRVLEDEVLPAFADPPRWTRMMRASIRMAVERFSSDRMVREYFDRLYPAPS